MKIRSTILLLLFFAVVNQTYSQTFSVTGINTDKFPRVRASFIAMKSATEPYTDLTKVDFSVKENGIDMTPSLDIQCTTVTYEPEVSVLLILDKSGSMNTDSNNVRRFDWVQKACTTFINTLNFVGRTSVAISGFAKDVQLVSPFKTGAQKKDLLDSIQRIIVAGLTEYDPPFCDYVAGAKALLKTRPTDMRRIAIFLTDGQPDPNPKVDSIVRAMHDENIQVYCVTLLMPMNPDLATISAATGGKSFEVHSEAALNDIYKAIALDIQSKILCEISWDSPFGCDESSRYRDAEITFKRIGTIVNRPFIAPPQSIAKINVSEEAVDFGNPLSGAANAVKKYITITSPLAKFTVKDIYITGSPYFKVTHINYPLGAQTKPFTLDSGESRIIEVTFTQQDPRQYKQGTLVIDALPCTKNVFLSGGAGQVKVVTPNGGEIYSLCDTVDVIWTGVEANTPVNIFYSDNNGSTWNPIVSNVTKNPYKWKAPLSGVQYKIKVVVSPSASYQWAKTIGGAKFDSATSCKVQQDGNFVYVTGVWTEEAMFDGTNRTLSQGGSQDIFTQKYDLDGNLQWTKVAGGYADDIATGITVDEINNAFITGTTYQNAQFGAVKPTMERANQQYAFVAKYSPDGNMNRVTVFGAKDVYTGFQANSQAIKYDQTNKKFYIHGKYTGEIIVTIAGGLKKSLPKSGLNVWKDYTAEFDYNLNLTDLTQGFTAPGYSSNQSIDSKGNRYDCGSYTGSKTIGTIKITSAGSNDGFISRYGGIPGSEDISDAIFAVNPQLIRFKGNAKTINVGSQTLGATRTYTAAAIIENYGDIVIDSWKNPVSISGPNAGDFQLDRPLATNIPKNGTSDIVINFTPGATGPRVATLTISGSCSNPISIDLIGNGVCDGDPIDVVDFGSVSLNTAKDSIVEKIFTNPNGSAIQIDPKLVYGNRGFSIVNPPGRIFVQPNESIALTVKFLPTVEGPALDSIDYQMPTGCENPMTELRGIGVKSDIQITPAVWGERRVHTVNKGKIIIKNGGALPATIEGLSFKEASTEIVYDGAAPSTPIVIPGNESREINVLFKPIAEITGSSIRTIQVKVLGRSDTLIAENSGIGVNPQITYEWICPEPATKAGSTGTAILRLKNNSIKKDAKVQYMSFSPASPNFKWETPANAVNFSVPYGETLDINVTYTPQAPGSNTAWLVKSADIAIGNDIDDVYPQWLNDTNRVVCEALSAGENQLVAFNNWQVCDSATKQFIIKNDASQTDLIIYKTGTQLSGTGKDAFYFNIPADVRIPGGESYGFNISFKPAEPKAYVATLSLANSQGQNIVIDLTGTGIQELVETKQLDLKIPPGRGKILPVYMNVPALDKGDITSLTVEIEHNPDMVYIDGGMFNKIYTNNWTWQNPVKVQPGIWSVTGSGRMPTPFNGLLFEIGAIVYLGNVDHSDISYRVTHEPCAAQFTKVMSLTLDSVCFVDGRLITLSDLNYSMSDPMPNPALENTEIEFSIAFDGATRIEIIDINGEIIDIPVNAVYKKGVYKLSINSSMIGSGVYMIRFSSGHYSTVKRLLIAK